MDNREWGEIFVKELKRAEKELADFNNAVAKHRLRIYDRDMSGERDVTEQNRNSLEAAVEEYRTLVRLSGDE